MNDFLEINAHFRVATLCEHMANEVYETLATNNAWYAKNKDRNAFIRLCSPTLREEARSILGELLGRDDVPETEKALIHDALVKDNSIPRQGVWTLPRQPKYPIH